MYVSQTQAILADFPDKKYFTQRFSRGEIAFFLAKVEKVEGARVRMGVWAGLYGAVFDGMLPIGVFLRRILTAVSEEDGDKSGSLEGSSLVLR